LRASAAIAAYTSTTTRAHPCVRHRAPGAP
jgi:hypothetical protein